MEIQVTEALADVHTKLLHLTAIIDDAIYIKGSQTLLDPPEYKPGLFQASIDFESLSEEFNPNAVDLIGQLDEQDLDMCDWQLVDTSDHDI